MSSTGAIVFVVDDDAELRETLSWLLESAGLRVKGYATAEAFLAEYQSEDHGCLLLDVQMPGGASGLELQETLRKIGVPIPIIIMTGHDHVPTAVRALKGGALDFIQKPFGDQALLERVQHALDLDRRGQAVRKECSEFVTLLATLTPREQEVMRLVMEGKANKVIAFDLGISHKTVEIHRGRVMSKLQVDSVAELVRLELLSRTDPSQRGFPW